MNLPVHNCVNGRVFCKSALSRFCDNEQSSSELGGTPVKRVRRPLGIPQAAFLIHTDTPLRHSYHSRRVIARSASRKRYADKWRTLARAPSGSLTTRIPRNRESRYGVTSYTRTYRRVEVAAKVKNELRKNRGSKLETPKQGKSCSVSESRKNS
jgi:hypothetical protein